MLRASLPLGQPNASVCCYGHQAPSSSINAWHSVPCKETYLSFEGLLNISTQCAPLVSFLKRVRSKLHPGLHLVNLHQDLKERPCAQGSNSPLGSALTDLKQCFVSVLTLRPNNQLRK